MNRFALCLSIILFGSASVLGQSGLLKVTSFPSGAQVTIDGVNNGRTTPMSTSLSIGEHTVTVSIPNSGWNPDTRTVMIVAGNNDLSVTLLPTLTMGPQGPEGPPGPEGPLGPAGPSGASPFSLDGSNAIYTQGNVGIGIANPSAKLHIGFSDTASLEIKDTVRTGLFTRGEMYFRDANGDGVGLVGPDGITNEGRAVFSLWSYQPRDVRIGTNDLTRLTVTGEGNVGIGTSNPVVRLDVTTVPGHTPAIAARGPDARIGSYYVPTAGVDGLAGFEAFDAVNPNGGFILATPQRGSTSHVPTAGDDDTYLTTRYANNLLLATANTERMRITSGGNVGIGTTSPVAALHVVGNFIATGTKSSVVTLPNDRTVALYAVESPENWFEDFGSGKLIAGAAHIVLDPVFAHTVNTEITYHVFLTPNAECRGLYVAQKSPSSFEVRELRGGKSNITFDYRIVARRKGYENLRMSTMPKNP